MNTRTRRNIRPWDEMDQEARNYRARIDAGSYDVTPHDGSLIVQKLDGAAYLVSQDSCTCEDWQHRVSKGEGRACKHQMMAGAWLLENGITWEGECFDRPVSCVRPRTEPAPGPAGPAGPEELARSLLAADYTAEDALFDRLYG